MDLNLSSISAQLAQANGMNNIQTYNTQNTTSTTQAETVDFESVLETTQSTSLDSIFKKASEIYNVPENLIKAVAKAESNFKPEAVSSSGAQGVMQLMPATAEYLGVTDSFDAEQNIMGGTKYLKELLDKYEGDTKLALAAYNAGMGNVAKYGGIPPFTETQNYVVKVMNYAQETIDVPDTYVSTNISNSTTTAPKNVMETFTLNETITINLDNNLSEYAMCDVLDENYYQTVTESISDFDTYTDEDYLYFVEMLSLQLGLGMFDSDSSSSSDLFDNITSNTSSTITSLLSSGMFDSGMTQELLQYTTETGNENILSSGMFGSDFLGSDLLSGSGYSSADLLGSDYYSSIIKQMY